MKTGCSSRAALEQKATTSKTHQLFSVLTASAVGVGGGGERESAAVRMFRLAFEKGVQYKNKAGLKFLNRFLLVLKNNDQLLTLQQ